MVTPKDPTTLFPKVSPSSSKFLGRTCHREPLPTCHLSRPYKTFWVSRYPQHLNPYKPIHISKSCNGPRWPRRTGAGEGVMGGDRISMGPLRLRWRSFTSDTWVYKLSRRQHVGSTSWSPSLRLKNLFITVVSDSFINIVNIPSKNFLYVSSEQGTQHLRRFMYLSTRLLCLIPLFTSLCTYSLFSFISGPFSTPLYDTKIQKIGVNIWLKPLFVLRNFFKLTGGKEKEVRVFFN